jgi:23S rRNA maturation-related 3'-5' exoribonuclease YhaM
MIIAYKLKPFKSLKHKKQFVMKVNDMRIEGYKILERHNSGWQLYIYHDDKFVERKFYAKPSATVEYLNGYIEVARTPISWVIA